MSFLIPILVRAFLIVFSLAGWIASAIVVKNDFYWVDYFSLYTETRDLYLGFFVAAFVVSCILFVLIFFNLTNWSFMNRLPFILIILCTDMIFIPVTLILSVMCAVKESELDTDSLLKSFLNIGAFGSAATFGFICTLLYVIDAFYMITKIVKHGVDAKVPLINKT